MRVETTGVVVRGICQIQGSECVARQPAPITVVWELPARRQVNVCKPCLEEQIRAGRWAVESAKIKTRADLAVYDAQGKLQLVVEVRQPLLDSSLSWKTWVRKIHRNLYAHSGLPTSQFLLVIGFPDFYALWRHHPMIPGRHPDFEGDLGGLLNRYLSYDRTADSHVLGYQAQHAVERWLKDLVASDRPPTDPHLQWIHTSRLFDTIRHGTIENPWRSHIAHTA
jgi:hypothetical protein